jgi:hypothetical protein
MVSAQKAVQRIVFYDTLFLFFSLLLSTKPDTRLGEQKHEFSCCAAYRL